MCAGAIQAGDTWKGPYFITGDTKPDGKGGSVGYTAPYRAYGSLAEGAEDMVRLICTGYGGRAVGPLVAGDVAAFAEAMRGHRRSAGDLDDRPGYYEGAGATPRDRTLDRARALFAAVLLQANEIDPERRFETLPDGRPCPPTLREGSTGRWVAVVRKILALDPQGSYPVGDVRRWQTARGQRAVGSADGVWGARSWGHCLAWGLLP